MQEENQELYDINIPKFVYNKLVQISENYLKYISGYKSLTKDYIKNLKGIHKTYSEKIKSIRIECEKNKYLDLSLLFPILNTVPNINSSFVDCLQFMANELESAIEGHQKFMKEQKIIYNKFFQNYNETKKDLLMKMNDLEKEKNNFLNCLSLTEKSISEFYSNKLKIEDYSKDHVNSVNNNEINELKNLFTQNNLLETQMEKSIKDSQKIEKDYKTLISNSKIFKKTFFFASNTTYENIKAISYEIIIDLKNFIQNIIILLKNCFNIPLKEIDSDLEKLIKNKEEYNKKFSNLFINLVEKVNDQYLIEGKRYSLKVFNSDNINEFIFEDNIDDDSSYIDSDLEYLIAKQMLSSFTFINEKYKINFELEDEKRSTNKIMSNLLCNIEKNYRKKSLKEINISEINNSENDNNNNEIKYVHENDIQQLYKLLNKHHNRSVCLQTLSHFRTLGKFCMPPKVFDIIGKCLLIIIDNITKDQDYHIAKTAMILSQTYFKIGDDNEKYYLQNIIKDHKLFTRIEFWEKSLELSIKKEIGRVKNIKEENEIKDGNNNDKNKIEDDDLEKYNDIAFGQIVSLVNSMIEFDINLDYIKKIINPKIEEYKLSEDHKTNINLVIENKINSCKNVRTKFKMEKKDKNNHEENKENINNIKKEENEINNKSDQENNINNIDNNP